MKPALFLPTLPTILGSANLRWNPFQYKGKCSKSWKLLNKWNILLIITTYCVQQSWSAINAVFYRKKNQKRKHSASGLSISAGKVVPLCSGKLWQSWLRASQPAGNWDVPREDMKFYNVIMLWYKTLIVNN